MVVISRFRSTWGIDPGPDQSHWKKKFVEWKAHGYAGVEITLNNFPGMSLQTLQNLRSACDELGLDITAVVFSSWPRDAGYSPLGLTPEMHLDFYKEQLRLAVALNPVVVTAQSGSDYWDWDESVRFYRMTFQVDQEVGIQGKVCHETHRKRSLFNPRAARYILERVPELRVTADISHWVVVGERLLDQGEEDVKNLNALIPHIGHIHTRIGTTQSSQCPVPCNPVFATEREFFEKYWLDIMDWKKRQDPKCRITWVPEYGPFPYHPIGTLQTHDELADSEAKRLEGVFNRVI